MQVSEDAEDFSLSGHEFASLVSSNAARGITARLEDVTNFGKSSLHFLPMRFKADDDDDDDDSSFVWKKHPFLLLRSHIERILDGDEYFFEVLPQPAPSGPLECAHLRS